MRCPIINYKPDEETDPDSINISSRGDSMFSHKTISTTEGAAVLENLMVCTWTRAPTPQIHDNMSETSPADITKT